MRKGTIVRFRDGRVAVKRYDGAWEVTGSTMVRYRNADLEDHVVVWVPPKNVVDYALGTILRIGEEPYIKTGHSVPGGGFWEGAYGPDLNDTQVEASDYIELFVPTTGE